MIVFNHEHTIHFDCDDTLVCWGENHTQPFEGSVSVICPHDGNISYLRPHKRHIRFLKKQVAKGVGVVIWSAAGVGWAKAVTEALELDKLEILVIAKPDKVVDDLPLAKDILPTVIFLNEEGYSA